MGVVSEGARDGFLLDVGELFVVETEGSGVDEVGEHGRCLQPVLGVEREGVTCSRGNGMEWGTSLC